jgi:hypothetical protein
MLTTTFDFAKKIHQLLFYVIDYVLLLLMRRMIKVLNGNHK